MSNPRKQFSPEEMDAALGLLATVHRDGGHYAEAHGLREAFVDACAVVVAERVAREDAERLLQPNVIHYPHGKSKIDAMTAPPKAAVHVLYHGMPLCVFSTVVPGEWPIGHTWVSLEQHEYATCPVCIARVPNEWKIGGDR